jgi:Fuc2NAc and GlcNAc transferase
MTLSRICLVIVSAILAGAALTWVARLYALRRSILDVPNERSSHVNATPRGGGIAIVIPTLLAVVLLWSTGRIDAGLAVAVGLCGGVVAAIGWFDDHRPLGVATRAATHLAAAVAAILALSPALSPWVMALYVLGIAWYVNLYNFLDGTDGYAGTQAVCTSLAGAALFAHAGGWGAAALCLVVAGASAGFLSWNWPPARIFMGDVGSCFLGFVFAVLAVHGERTGVAPAWLWVLLLGPFFWDATLTLLRRVATGERWHQAHRTHAYQRLHQLGWTHRRIAASLLVVNVFVVWPMVWVAVLWDNFALFSTFAASAVLIALWWSVNRRFRGQDRATSDQHR